VLELSIAELAEPMEVEGKGKEKLVAANDSFDVDDANDDLEKFEGYNALVMQDYFTKWPEAIPLKDVTTKLVAGALLSVISTWGPPAELLSNQGLEFVVELNRKLSRQWGIKR